MQIGKRSEIPGREFPAGRESVNIAGGRSPLQPEGFSLGHVVLHSDGGQVPWHNHPQEEIYYLLTGSGEMCVAEERAHVVAGDVVYIPPFAFHQLTNTGPAPLEFIYCYSPAGDVAHWRQELDGTLPRASVDAPSLPEGASPQKIADANRENEKDSSTL
jgi:oxalate decarboxylase/phosphoglucose isomerase-like protein (cupin superfamily)